MPVKTKIDFVLTAISPHQPPKLQLSTIARWLPSVGTAVVYGRCVAPEAKDGLEFHSSANRSTTIVEILVGYLARNPSEDLVAICNPNIILSLDASSVFDHINKAGGNGKAWSFFINGPSGSPEMIVVTSPVLLHMVKDTPSDLTLDDSSWSVWMHDWLVNHMPIHRFVDATTFGLVVERIPPAPEPASLFSVADMATKTINEISQFSRPWVFSDDPPTIAPDAIPEAVEAVIIPVEVKTRKKRGRPRKALK